MTSPFPPYWTPRPASPITDEERTAFEETWRSTTQSSDAIPLVELPPSIQKWRFLDWLVQSEGVLLHGSVRADIRCLRPSLPNDHSADKFSKQTAVYATTDAIWSIYYAVLDRSFGQRYLNACLQFAQEDGWSGLHYFFSLDRGSLANSPWRTGFAYVLSPSGFVQQPAYEVQAWTVLDPHFAKPDSVRPIAKDQVQSSDFPLIGTVRSHVDAAVISAQATDPYGFPWIDQAIDPIPQLCQAG